MASVLAFAIGTAVEDVGTGVGDVGSCVVDTGTGLRDAITGIRRIAKKREPAPVIARRIGTWAERTPRLTDGVVAGRRRRQVAWIALSGHPDGAPAVADRGVADRAVADRAVAVAGVCAAAAARDGGGAEREGNDEGRSKRASRHASSYRAHPETAAVLRRRHAHEPAKARAEGRRRLVANRQCDVRGSRGPCRRVGSSPPKPPARSRSRGLPSPDRSTPSSCSSP